MERVRNLKAAAPTRKPRAKTAPKAADRAKRRRHKKENYCNNPTTGVKYKMAQIFDEGNVVVYIPNGSKEPYARCYDRRDEDFRTLIVIDLFTFLPENFGDENPDHEIPQWSFLIEAIQACVKHQEQLWAAWESIKDDPEV